MEYNIVYSARKTLVVRIADGQATVLAPKKFEHSAEGQKQIRRFLSEKSAWIEKKIHDFARRRATILPGILELEAFYLHGSELDTVRLGKGKSIRLSAELLTIPETIPTEALVQALKKAYRQYARQELSERLTELADRLKMSFLGFRLSDAGTRWGSCTSQARISLNWRLVILPPRFRDYVIIHELCHTVHLNHSEAFWQQVERVLPDYRKLRSELKAYGFLTAYLK